MNFIPNPSSPSGDRFVSGLAGNGHHTNGHEAHGQRTNAVAPANYHTRHMPDDHDHIHMVDASVGASAQARVSSYDPHFEGLVEQMLLRLGEDPGRDGLLRTPLRVAKAMDDLTSGYRTDLRTVVNDAIFADDGDEMVVVKDIEFFSLCEHHMLPFYGKVTVAYIPKGRIIGLSKLARVTDLFARRLQVQERLTNQIADALVEVLQPTGVAVMAEAAHFCMMMRGVQKQHSTTVTTALRGAFKQDQELRQRFTALAGGRG